MRQKKFWFTMSAILAVLGVALMLPAGAVAASKYKILHRFAGRTDGRYPYAGLVFDSAGNLYGTTLHGGSQFDAGTVFKLTPNSDGSWKESVLYAFTGGADGAFPWGGLIFDAAGNLYGTTAGGGSTNCRFGCGTVFKLVPNPNGSWTESVLHSFSGADGVSPRASLIFDTAGNLYGTTVEGGFTCQAGYSCGVVFELSLNSHGSWTESVLHTFTGADGQYPYAMKTKNAVYNTDGSVRLFLVAAGPVQISLDGKTFEWAGTLTVLNPDGSFRKKFPFALGAARF